MPCVRNRKTLADSLVGARPVVGINIFVENAVKMAFIDDQNDVKERVTGFGKSGTNKSSNIEDEKLQKILKILNE